jgi:hypothetical protein
MSTESRPSGPYVSQAVASELSGMSPYHVRAAIAAGEVRTRRIRGVLYVDLADLDQIAGAPATEGGRP